jgi:hypothetical protein
MEELPESDTAFLTPFHDGPERRWEDHDYQLTDLKSVKAKMKLRNSDHQRISYTLMTLPMLVLTVCNLRPPSLLIEIRL